MIELGADGSYEIPTSIAAPPPPSIPTPRQSQPPSSKPTTTTTTSTKKAPEKVGDSQPPASIKEKEVEAERQSTDSSNSSSYSYEIFELRKEGEDQADKVRVRVHMPPVRQLEDVRVRAHATGVEVHVLKGEGGVLGIKLPHRVNAKDCQATLWEQDLSIVLPIQRISPSE